MNDYTMIIEGLITIIIGLVSAFVIPWIKAKINAEDLAEIVKWVKIAVQAAEQIYKESGMGPAKKAYVVSFLNDRGVMFNEKEIDTLIESAVLELKKELLNESV